MDVSPAQGELAGSDRRVGTSLDRWVDLWVVAAWCALIVFVGFTRFDYTGDGLRHLPAIVGGVGFHLGEPRWLLFPGFLYLLLRPFVVLGIAPDVESLAHVMMGATVLCGAAYMLSLRVCLVAARVEPRRRAAALALAGASAGLLLASTDLMEPIFGAALIVCGLGWSARRASRPDATPAALRRTLYVALGLIAVATLMYQGLILAVGLLPLVFPRAVLRDRRALVPSLLILAAVPLVMVGALMLGGDTLGHALARALKGEENVLYSAMNRKPGLGSRVVALVGGPPQGIVVLRDFHGVKGLLAGLRGGAGRGAAIKTLAVFGLGGLIVLSGLVSAVRRRDRAVLIAFGVMMLLPVVRSAQYGYLKYYIFMAVIVAFGAARARPSIVAALAVVVALINVGPVLTGVSAARHLYTEQMKVYARADAQSCWVSSGWIPPYSFRWPGRICGMLAHLSSGHAQTEAEVEAAARASLTACLEACFCHSSAVYINEDMTEPAAPYLAAEQQLFQYTDIDLGELVLPEARGERVSPAGSYPVYRYPSADQLRICRDLGRARGAAR
jgi:hypothetical protein